MATQGTAPRALFRSSRASVGASSGEPSLISSGRRMCRSAINRLELHQRRGLQDGPLTTTEAVDRSTNLRRANRSPSAARVHPCACKYARFGRDLRATKRRAASKINIIHQYSSR